MSKILKSKYKLCHKTQFNLWSSPKIDNFKRKKWLRVKRSNKPYFHLFSGSLKLQKFYSLRLKSKQFLRAYYGNISEKHFVNFDHGCDSIFPIALYCVSESCSSGSK